MGDRPRDSKSRARGDPAVTLATACCELERLLEDIDLARDAGVADATIAALRAGECAYETEVASDRRPGVRELAE